MKKTIWSAEFEVYCRLLRAARLEAGLGQRGLAKRLGTDQSWISKCEGGERRLDAVELWRYCHGMGIAPAEFMRRLDEELSKLPPEDTDASDSTVR